jgi:hypothetical protein
MSGTVIQPGHVGRLGVLLLSVMLAGVFVGVGHAGDVLAPADAIESTSSGTESTSSGTEVGTSADGAVVSDETASSEAPPETVEGEAPPVETPTESPPETSTDSPPPESSTESPPAETTPETSTESPPLETSPEAPLEPAPSETPEAPPLESAPPEATAPETPPSEASSDPISSSEDGSPMAPGFGPASADVSALFPALQSAALVPAGDNGSAGGQGAGRDDTDRKSSRGQGALRPVFSPMQSPASSPSSGSSSGSAPSASGTGHALFVEFMLPVLVMLVCAFGLSFALPHSSAFALRSERPG